MLSIVAAISGLYDSIVGAVLLIAPDSLASLFGVPAASPRIFSDLNGLFLIAVGVGYYLPWRDPDRYRAYMWIMGPLLKGAGATIFLLDYAFRGSPASFLLFAASDGTLALLTVVALLRTRASIEGRSLQH
jgi:hypothetical protein